MSAAATLPRLGPRPLPLQLWNAIGAWLSSRAALPLLRSGLLLSRPDFADRVRALQESLAAAAFDQVAAALDRELRNRAGAFLGGIEAYRRHPYRRTVPDPPVLWQEGTTRLLDYGAAAAPAVLIVPSLINRAYILDLAPEASLVRYLAAAGLRPLLVDWGSPGPLERGFGLTEYIAGRLEMAAEVAGGEAKGPIGVMGYCMGGLLALALAERRPRLVAALALLATPWRFHVAPVDAAARLLGALAEPLTQAFAALGELPVDVLQALFTAVDPMVAVRKFTRFASLPSDGAAARQFVAVEDWLNDGVPLALRVARECLVGWYGADLPGHGLWPVAGRPVLPVRMTAPALVVVPAQDRIVPPASAAALADALPAAERLTPALGHIGMIVGAAAQRQVWRPLASWLRRHLPPPGSNPRRRGLFT
jgi:poly[(R)-3-hydroxyalkanoate] polymerase subunit PhaC